MLPNQQRGEKDAWRIFITKQKTHNFIQKKTWICIGSNEKT